MTNSCTLVLPAVLESTYAATLMQEFNARQGSQITISGESVTRASTLCIQVILSACATWKNAGITFQFVSPSDAFSSIIKRLGLDMSHLSWESSH